MGKTNKELPDGDDELLKIKEAASFLNVSEISLRRWTDQGKLHCYRIGNKQERRFLKSRLTLFLEKQKVIPQEKAYETSSNRQDHVLLEGMSISYGNHLCSLFHRDSGRLKMSIPFLAEGLRNNDVCILIASKKSTSLILEKLSEINVNPKLAIKKGKLVVSEGRNSSSEMLEFLEQQFIMATQSGNRYLRVLNDLSWFVEQKAGLENLFEFENSYNHSLAKRFPVVSLCQYDARLFSGTSIVNALISHEDTFKFSLPRFIGG